MESVVSTVERREYSGPAQRFLVHVQLLSRMRDAALSKMRVDQLKLIQLGNLLNASFESEELREHSDLEVAKMIVNWWKALVESDVASIDRDVKAENVAILRYWIKYYLFERTSLNDIINDSSQRCWNAVVEDELSKLNEEVRSNLKEVPTVPFKDKIEELESVMQSISSMRSRLEEGVAVLEQALLQIGSPSTLLELSLERVTEEEGLPKEELPATLVTQLRQWPSTRDICLREKLGVLAKAVVKISEILLS